LLGAVHPCSPLLCPLLPPASETPLAGALPVAQVRFEGVWAANGERYRVIMRPPPSNASALTNQLQVCVPQTAGGGPGWCGS
jgi:hypothetical protein